MQTLVLKQQIEILNSGLSKERAEKLKLEGNARDHHGENKKLKEMVAKSNLIQRLKKKNEQKRDEEEEGEEIVDFNLASLQESPMSGWMSNTKTMSELEIVASGNEQTQVILGQCKIAALCLNIDDLEAENDLLEVGRDKFKNLKMKGLNDVMAGADATSMLEERKTEELRLENSDLAYDLEEALQVIENLKEERDDANHKNVEWQVYFDEQGGEREGSEIELELGLGLEGSVAGSRRNSFSSVAPPPSDSGGSKSGFVPN